MHEPAREPVRTEPTAEERQRAEQQRVEQQQADVRSRSGELTTADMANPTRQNPPQSSTQNVTPFPSTAAQEAQPGPETTPLLGESEASGFRSRWDTVQAEFVDDPRRAVENADHLVAEAIQRLAQVFADERAKLEHQWDRGDNVSTEDLRLALQHYRSFFQRLLAA